MQGRKRDGERGEGGRERGIEGGRGRERRRRRGRGRGRKSLRENKEFRALEILL